MGSHRGTQGKASLKFAQNIQHVHNTMEETRHDDEKYKSELQRDAPGARIIGPVKTEFFGSRDEASEEHQKDEFLFTKGTCNFPIFWDEKHQVRMKRTISIKGRLHIYKFTQTKNEFQKHRLLNQNVNSLTKKIVLKKGLKCIFAQNNFWSAKKLINPFCDPTSN